MCQVHVLHRVIRRTQKQPEYTTLMEMSWCTATYVTGCCEPIVINTVGDAFIARTTHVASPTPPSIDYTISPVVDRCVPKVVAFSSCSCRGY